MKLKEELEKRFALMQQLAQRRQVMVNEVNNLDAETLRTQGEVRLLQKLVAEEQTEDQEDGSSE